MKKITIKQGIKVIYLNSRPAGTRSCSLSIAFRMDKVPQHGRHYKVAAVFESRNGLPTSEAIYTKAQSEAIIGAPPPPKSPLQIDNRLEAML